MEQNHNKQGNYLRFFAMIGTSMVIMYFLMYLNSYQIVDHARFSETRLFMTTMMGGAMMAVMLSFMMGMYKNRRANAAIFVGAGLMILLAVWLVRSQVTVTDVDYMEGMIPHHSIAILTSERAGIEDLRVRELADAILEAQRREINEMEWLIEDIRANGLAETEEEANARPVPVFSAAPE
jgi:FlaA1/EpsC-like NDP-sugar epimerase